jgi:hypothetical protein
MVAELPAHDLHQAIQQSLRAIEAAQAVLAESYRAVPQWPDFRGCIASDAKGHAGNPDERS